MTHKCLGLIIIPADVTFNRCVLRVWCFSGSARCGSSLNASNTLGRYTPRSGIAGKNILPSVSPKPASGKGKTERVRRPYMATDSSSLPTSSNQCKEWTKSGHCIWKDFGSNPDSITAWLLRSWTCHLTSPSLSLLICSMVIMSTS